MHTPKEYKVIVVTEGALGTLIFGASKLSEKTLTDALNSMAAQGWDFQFMAIEQRRFALLWTRDAAVITFSRSRQV